MSLYMADRISQLEDRLTVALARVMELEERDQDRRRELRIMQRSLESKNRSLDALHYVWCKGGCKGGVHRWSENTITEAVVRAAEANTARLRVWWENHRSRDARAALAAGEETK